jgi:hypothetical protein
MEAPKPGFGEVEEAKCNESNENSKNEENTKIDGDAQQNGWKKVTGKTPKAMKTIMMEALKEQEEEKKKEEKQEKEEQDDCARRSTNLLVFRAPVSKKPERKAQTDEDQKLMQDLCEKLGLQQDEVKEVTRLGKREADKNRPIRVVLQDTDSKKELFSNLKNLKSSEERLGSLIIGHDLTPRQRTERNAMIQEAKEKSDEEYICLVRSSGPQWDPKIVRMRRRTDGETQQNHR